MLVVSEETAIVSLARAGMLQRGLSPEQVLAMLAARLPAPAPAQSAIMRAPGGAARTGRGPVTAAVLAGYVLTLAPTRHLLGCGRVHRRGAAPSAFPIRRGPRSS